MHQCSEEKVGTFTIPGTELSVLVLSLGPLSPFLTSDCRQKQLKTESLVPRQDGPFHTTDEAWS